MGRHVIISAWVPLESCEVSVVGTSGGEDEVMEDGASCSMDDLI